MNETFEEYLRDQNLSQNTIISYLFTVKQYYELYGSVKRKNLRDYKVYLIEHYKPQTVNLRIRAIICFLESIQKEKWKLTSVKVQQKPFLEIHLHPYKFLSKYPDKNPGNPLDNSAAIRYNTINANIV